jgi:hypothetical protein
LLLFFAMGQAEATLAIEQAAMDLVCGRPSAALEAFGRLALEVNQRHVRLRLYTLWAEAAHQLGEIDLAAAIRCEKERLRMLVPLDLAARA